MLGRKKCSMDCGNKLPKDPYKIIIESEEGDAEPVYICDECAQLLNVINAKIYEMNNDDSL